MEEKENYMPRKRERTSSAADNAFFLQGCYLEVICFAMQRKNKNIQKKGGYEE